MSESFPRMYARTRRFTLGVPRGFTIAPGGDRVVFLRSRSGTDPVTSLWELDLGSGVERLVLDPARLGADDEHLPAEERARRERAREQGGGVVAYTTDAAVTSAAFALSGGLHVVELASGEVRRFDTPGAVIDPRLSPDGTRVAYVTGGALHVLELASGDDRTLAAPEAEGVTYGLAEFAAAEEFDRLRGHWWSPDGTALLAERADVSPVQTWHIADPANPSRPPVSVAYPAAGTPNAVVELVILGLDGSRTAVPFDDEYLISASWGHQGPLIVTMPRDQKTVRVLSADPATGSTELLGEDCDDAWVEAASGVPARLDDGTLVWVADSEGARRLLIGGVPVSPPNLQVREVLGVDGGTVLFRASTDPTEIHLFTWARAASSPAAGGDRPAGVVSLVTSEPGVHTGRLAGGTLVTAVQTLDGPGTAVWVRRGEKRLPIASLAERPRLEPRVALVRTGERDLSTAVLLPSGHVPGSRRLPVLMDPYGGPHAQRVTASGRTYLEPQWFADQGFAVIVADGRGTPGRGPAFEREIQHDLAGPVLDDQVDALHGAARLYPDDLDLGRVAIKGWSFGGFLAALAVLRRPDVFHAAIAGAPVTDWRLYDTAYTERYLGHPDEHPEAYERSSLLADAARPEKLERPLLLIHGLADDNVVAAHTLRLSSALLAAGRPHTVLPLSGVTHMTPQEVVAENLLLLQVDFLRKSLDA
ncbi:prolyl oligopeptidase family serine peptidase [Sphaerisporangium sp. TRM90804]|uniref:S9 family peptidase n=1 Tax=Sphaerisporangium sp. TRM90804 TaxID=3031113 RepID=UPI00244BEC54|nr:prolyl oligopeptidase family serine peptidase [Sphaerisporangium sp. TRM90804]MDH2429900.1 prolyl oligopeptidase family serine peptidase [Sphaerisporangium sp. TRM90804]